MINTQFMKEQSDIRGRVLIKFLLITFRSIFLLYSLSLILYLIITTISLNTRNQENYISLPVLFEFTETGNLISSEGESISNVNLHYATGIIDTPSLPRTVGILSLLVNVLISTCILLIIRLICQILDAANTSDFLMVKNAIRMRNMALLFIVVFFIDKLNLLISSLYLSDKLEFSGITFTGINYYFFSRWEYVFFYLFLLVIAEAFRIGSLLKEENDLTI